MRKKVKTDTKIRIIIDALCIRNHPTGLGNYSYYLIENLIKLGDYSFTILYQKDLTKSHRINKLINDTVKFIPINIPIIGPKREYRFLTLSRVIDQYDLFHCLSSYLPAFGVQTPSIVTIHDLKYLLFPDFLSNFIKRKYYVWIIRKSIQKATRIIVVSNTTKKDVIKQGGRNSKITVIHEAATLMEDKTQNECHMPDEISKKPYYLFVGENRPHKNIDRILDAYKILNFKLKEECPKFVFAGNGFSTFQQQKNRAFFENLIFLGSVSDNLLISLYKHALALVYPSLYEGFGLPILEAMSFGTPVITSNCSSMPEVAGNAAILVRPNNVNEIEKALFKLANDRNERERLKILGLQRVKKFSWEKAARQTLETYKQILSDR